MLIIVITKIIYSCYLASVYGDQSSILNSYYHSPPTAPKHPVTDNDLHCKVTGAPTNASVN